MGPYSPCLSLEERASLAQILCVRRYPRSLHLCYQAIFFRFERALALFDSTTTLLQSTKTRWDFGSNDSSLNILYLLILTSLNISILAGFV